MVEDMGYTGEQLGYHAGILAATFCGAQFCTSVAWGMISDRYGRRFAVVSGTFGAGIGMLIFGFAKTFPQGKMSRAAHLVSLLTHVSTQLSWVASWEVCCAATWAS